MNWKPNTHEDIYYKKKVLFTLSLYNKQSVTRDAVQDLIIDINYFVSFAVIPYLKEEYKLGLKEFNDEAAEKMKKKKFYISDKIKDPFSELSTEYNRFKIYQEISVYRPPEEYFIGFNQLTNLAEKGIHLSLLHTLKVFLELPGVFESIENYVIELKKETNYIENIIQGELWKSKYERNNGDIVWPLILSNDDFDPRNTIGSHGGKQKLTVSYVTIPVLPPHLVAKMENIFVVSVFYSKLRNKYGNMAVYRRIIEDLTLISKEGLKINVDGKNKLVFFECPLLAGDNLAQNANCGFVESFQSHYYCRLCIANSTEAKELTVENKELLRTEENYAIDSKNKTRGVKEENVFHKIPKFHIADNQSLDMMHDVNEGTEKDTIEKVLTTIIIKEKIISLEEVNDAIDRFDYGDMDKKNKPQPLRVEHCNATEKAILNSATKIQLKQSASEMSCLTRHLCLIIGNKIPKNNEAWTLYLLLRKIVGMILAPRFNKADVYELQGLIEKFLKLKIKLYKYLKPKDHFGTHMPRVLINNGPLVHFWSMPSERKHVELKDAGNSTSSNKNLPLTICVRMQLKLCCRKEFFQGVEKEIELGPALDEEISSHIKQGLSNDVPLTSHSYVKILGYKYCKNSVIFIECDAESGRPRFAKINNIYNINGSVFFFISVFDMIDFNNYYHAYEVLENNDPKTFYLYSVEKLSNVPPCLTTRKKENIYISTKYDI